MNLMTDCGKYLGVSAAGQWPTGWPDLTNVAATTEAARRAVLETRRRAYGRADTPKGVPLSDDFDNAPNTTSYLLLKDSDGHSEAVGTIRASTRALDDNVNSTPCSRIFGGEIAQRFGGMRFVEASRLAIVVTDRNEASRLYLALMQNVTRAADEHASDFILAPTRVEHTRIYLGMGFEAVAPGRPNAGFTASCLLALDWHSNRRVLAHHRRFHRLLMDWDRREMAA